MKITKNECFGWLGFQVLYKRKIWQIVNFDWASYEYELQPVFRSDHNIRVPMHQLFGCEIVGDAWEGSKYEA